MQSHPRGNRVTILILGTLTTVSPFSIDMYLPAFPPMAADLHTTVARMGLTISSYFVALAVGQLFYGPLLDRYGRKKPIYFGLTLYVGATIACAMSRKVDELIFFRFLQGLGGCAAQVGSVAMVRDFFPPEESARVFSALMLIVGVSPLLAPSAGGLIAAWFGWRAVFLFLVVIVAFIAFVIATWLPEGHTPDPTVELGLRPILRTFGGIFAHPQFFTYALSVSLLFSGLFVYVSGSPAIFMDAFRVSPQAYGGIFALLSVGFIGGNQLNLWFGRHHRSAKLYRIGAVGATAVATIFFVASVVGRLDLAATIVLLLGFLTCIGLSNPNGTALALAPFSRNAGSASSLIGFLQMGIGSIASAAAGLAGGTGLGPITAVLAASAALGTAALFIGSRYIGAPTETSGELPVTGH